MRFENSYGKGDTDMQVDAFGYAKSDEWSDWIAIADPSEVSAFYEGVAAGLSSEIPDEPVHPDPTDQPLDALYRKGKGKGKGKNSFRDKGKGKGYQGGDGGKGQGQQQQGGYQGGGGGKGYGQQQQQAQGGKGRDGAARTNLHCEGAT